MKFLNEPKNVQKTFWSVIILFVGAYIITPFLSQHISLLAPYNSYTAIKNDLGLSFGEFLTLINVIILGYLTYKSYFRHNQQFVKELYFPFYKELMESTYKIYGDAVNNKDKLREYIAWIKSTNFKNTLFLVDDKIKSKFNERKNLFIEALEEIENIPNLSMTSQSYIYLINTRDYFLDFVGAIIMNQTDEEFKISTQKPPVKPDKD